MHFVTYVTFRVRVTLSLQGEKTMTITPGTYDFTLYQGATFSRVITWKEDSDNLIDLSGYTARLMARESLDADEVFLNLTTENGGIVLGDEDGTITLSISAADTSAITATAGVYDLELISGSGIVTRLLQGGIVISKEVTR